MISKDKFESSAKAAQYCVEKGLSILENTEMGQRGALETLVLMKMSDAEAKLPFLAKAINYEIRRGDGQVMSGGWIWDGNQERVLTLPDQGGEMVPETHDLTELKAIEDLLGQKGFATLPAFCR